MSPRHGTWAETGGGAGAVVVPAAVLAAAVALIAWAVAQIMWVLVAGMFLAAAVIVALALRANRRPPPARELVYPKNWPVLPSPQRAAPAIEPPRVVHQHVHLHGLSPEEVAQFAAPRRRES